MLLRFTLSAAGAMVLAGSAFAQNATQAQPITSPVKDAGTFHLATGTWTRGVAPVALAGPEVIYDNTCTTGFYTGLTQGEDAGDSGRIPSTSSPSNTTSLTGLYDSYSVNGFTIAYCSFEPVVTTIGLGFYDCYAACDNGGAGYPSPATAAFALVNVPAGTATGSQGCWIIGFDLANTTFAFDLGGDCNGTYDNVASTDSFGWSWTQLVPTTGSNAGPLLTGDPLALFNLSCGGVGGGTTFPGASAGPGSGIGNLDQFELTNNPAGGCFWFGGYSAANPYSSFYLQLEGDQGTTTGPGPGSAYCFGDGGGGVCPCGNFGMPGQGCSNSTGNSGATLTGNGSASFSNDTLSFDIAGVPGAKPGLIIKGNNQVAIAAGDGLLCTTGQSQRSQVQVTSAGATTYTDFLGSPFGSVANMGAASNFQFWYRDPIGGPCGGGFNFTNGWTVTYQP